MTKQDKTPKQMYQCNTQFCHNRTYSTLSEVDHLEIEIAKCEKCKRLIVFSTLYNPVLYRPNVPVWANGPRVAEKVKQAKNVTLSTLPMPLKAA
jgi:hypothetical protein